MLGMGASRFADARYLFTKDTCGPVVYHQPRRGEFYRRLELELIRNERHADFCAGFEKFASDVTQRRQSGAGNTAHIKGSKIEFCSIEALVQR